MSAESGLWEVCSLQTTLRYDGGEHAVEGTAPRTAVGLMKDMDRGLLLRGQSLADQTGLPWAPSVASQLIILDQQDLIVTAEKQLQVLLGDHRTTQTALNCLSIWLILVRKINFFFIHSYLVFFWLLLNFMLTNIKYNS